MSLPTQLTIQFEEPVACGTIIGSADAVNAAAPRVFPGPALPDGDRRSEAQRSVDALMSSALRYRRSAEYGRLLQFIRGFRDYAPFNGLLVDVQKPGSTVVAPASRWIRDHSRVLRSGAQPLVILQPFGPVMFVFDVSDTEPLKDAPALPRAVTHPFDVSGGTPPAGIERAISRTVTNAVRDGVRNCDVPFGAQLAGRI